MLFFVCQKKKEKEKKDARLINYENIHIWFEDFDQNYQLNKSHFFLF